MKTGIIYTTNHITSQITSHYEGGTMSIISMMILLLVFVCFDGFITNHKKKS
jgi:hypothetical protein